MIAPPTLSIKYYRLWSVKELHFRVLPFLHVHTRLRQKYKAKAQSTSALGQVLTYCSVIHISIYITLATRFDSGWCTVVIKCTSNQAHHIAKDISRADVQCWLGTLEMTGFHMYIYWVCMVFQCCGRIFKNSFVCYKLNFR